MTYNIRYASDDEGENSWSERKEDLTALLKFYEPDVFGVQEALQGQLDHLKESLEKYRYVGVGRDDGADEGGFNAIFFDTEKFDLKKEDTFWLSETPGEPSTGWDSAYPRTCTCALLREKGSDKDFWVFSTHFDHQGKKARQNSAELVLDKIRDLNDRDLPVVLMGDLNLEPNNEPIHLLAKEMNDSREIAEKAVFGPEATFNGFDYDKPAIKRVDYIFTGGKDLRVIKYGVLNHSMDRRYPSDHFPILVVVDF